MRTVRNCTVFLYPILTRTLTLPGAAVAVKRIVLFHLLNTRVAQKAPGLTGFVLHAVHHGFLSVAVRTGFRSAHGIRG